MKSNRFRCFKMLSTFLHVVKKLVAITREQKTHTQNNVITVCRNFFVFRIVSYFKLRQEMMRRSVIVSLSVLETNVMYKRTIANSLKCEQWPRIRFIVRRHVKWKLVNFSPLIADERKMPMTIMPSTENKMHFNFGCISIDEFCWFS